MYGCQQHLIKESPEVMAFLEYICSEANKLTNCGIYYCRQMLFKAGKFLTRGALDKKMKSNIHFQFLLPMPSNLDFDSINEYRILPRNGCFYIEFVYQKLEVKPIKPNGNVLGIDPGLNNWITGVSNTGRSFIIDGKKVKSQNQWYHKQVANIKTGKPRGFNPWRSQRKS